MRNYPRRVQERQRSSYLRTPAKFIAEIQAVLSLVLVIIFGIVIIVYSVKENSRNKDAGIVMSLSVALIGSVLDLGLSFILSFGAKNMSVGFLLFWWRSCFASLITLFLLSISFSVLVGSVLLLLPVIPNALFKPFGLYVVSGFLRDIQVHRLRRPIVDVLRVTEYYDEDEVDAAYPSRISPTPSFLDETAGSDGKDTGAGETEAIVEPITGDARRAVIFQQKINFLNEISSPPHTGTQ